MPTTIRKTPRQRSGRRTPGCQIRGEEENQEGHPVIELCPEQEGSATNRRVEQDVDRLDHRVKGKDEQVGEQGGARDAPTDGEGQDAQEGGGESRTREVEHEVRTEGQ